MCFHKIGDGPAAADEKLRFSLGAFPYHSTQQTRDLARGVVVKAPKARRLGLKVQRSLQVRKTFFHEYRRRVGMVPRSSLKEGKYSQMVEKRTKTIQQKTN